MSCFLISKLSLIEFGKVQWIGGEVTEYDAMVFSSSNFQNIYDLQIGIEFGGRRRGGGGSSLQELQNLKDKMQLLQMVAIMVKRVGQHDDHDEPDHDRDDDYDHGPDDDYAKVV